MGVLPSNASTILDALGFPYASGGVARTNGAKATISMFSLRKWGCCRVVFTSKFPRISFPYASGGVADRISHHVVFSLFSLRKWGCCPLLRSLEERFPVFPTQVGVLPSYGNAFANEGSFPYASGGVAIPPGSVPIGTKFSLRKWGCCRLVLA